VGMYGADFGSAWEVATAKAGMRHFRSMGML